MAHGLLSLIDLRCYWDNNAPESTHKTCPLQTGLRKNHPHKLVVLVRTRDEL